MKYKILPAAFLFISLQLTAQKAETLFAITADAQSNLWMNISEVNVSNGKIVRPLFERSKTSFALYDGNTKTQLPNLQKPGSAGEHSNGTLMAAAAYDRRRYKLFMAPMQLPELRWVDLDDNNTTLKVFSLPLPGFTAATMNNDANHLTRMVIAADGNGYALTNDGNHLLQFTTGKKVTIKDLGALQDAGAVTTVSVHNRCSSWGGDMIAAADGDLYLISAYHAVFKINIAARTATYLQHISGLPANYTTNGAAVNAAGNLIVCSATSKDGYFKVDMNTWQAENMSEGNCASDLASSYLAFAKPETNAAAPLLKRSEHLQRIVVYPNPVTESLFRISFDSRETGRYQLQLTDLSGRVLLTKQLNIASNKQLVEVAVPAAVAKGMYLVKILNATGKTAYTDKIMIQ